MTVKDFIGVLNMEINYKIIDRDTKEEFKLYKNNRIDKNIANKNIYMVFNNNLDNFPSLNILVF